MKPFQNILVATDFSSGSRSALLEAARLAKEHGARLHVLHVYPKGDSDTAKAMFGEVAGSVDEHLTDKVRERISQELSSVGVSADETTVHARVGRVVSEVTSVVGEIGADLLVIGATGEDDRRWGTMAGRLVRRGPTRVLLVPPGVSGPFRKIIACADFSELTPEVVDQAGGLAQEGGGEATAIHCYEMPWERATLGGEVPQNALEVEEEYRGVLLKEYERAAGDTGGELLPRFEAVRDIDSGRGIVEYATANNADLVVTGTTGRSKLGYWLVGTTAEKVMRDTPCAVLALKSPEGPPDGSEGG